MKKLLLASLALTLSVPSLAAQRPASLPIGATGWDYDIPVHKSTIEDHCWRRQAKIDRLASAQDNASNRKLKAAAIGHSKKLCEMHPNHRGPFWDWAAESRKHHTIDGTPRKRRIELPKVTKKLHRLFGL